MTLQLREYRPEDWEQIAAIWSVAFYGNQPLPADSVVAADAAFVAEDNGRIVGGLRVCTLSASRGSAVLRCGGIAMVGVSPACRQRGVGRAMMSWSLERMHADGFHLSSLHPFRPSYYRALGWECAGSRVAIRCPNHRLPRTDGRLEARRVAPEDWQLLEGAYGAFASRYSGMSARDSHRWKRAMRRVALDPLVFAVGEPVEAYAILELSNKYWADEVVRELVWSTPAGYRSILSVLSGIAINKSTLTWEEPADGPFRSAWVDQGVEVTLQRPLMYRAVNVPAALAALEPEAAGEFSILVDDPQLPANRGPWRVAFGRDGVDVEPCSDSEIEINIRHFSQALLGEPSLRALVDHGFVVVKSDRAAAAAAALLPPQPTYCLEMF